MAGAMARLALRGGYGCLCITCSPWGRYGGRWGPKQKSAMPNPHGALLLWSGGFVAVWAYGCGP
mgnify:CR=1 FL=1